LAVSLLNFFRSFVRFARTTPGLVQIALWVIVLALIVAQVYYSERVFEDHIFNDDFRQNFFWVKALVEPEYFKNDYIAHYQRDFSSVGMELLYWPQLKLGLSPNEASKILSGVFYGGFLLAIFFLGRFLDRGRAGFMTPLILIFVLLNNYYFVRFIMGGIARSTAFPLQVMLAVFLLRRKFWWALATTAACAFFHPQTFPRWPRREFDLDRVGCAAAHPHAQGLAPHRATRRRPTPRRWSPRGLALISLEAYGQQVRAPHQRSGNGNGA
jgi:hypothetical protein